ncbi:MAG TPA: hypothetical protein VE909_13545, partial [Xanthobacteraceae bacterium]|nr:hypothetical protein [Xanthobacteraceae bacterium]
MPLLADLQDEFALHGEFEQLSVLLAVAGEPSRSVELLSLPLACFPICSTNLPSIVNLRSWPSVLPFPASHTKS